MSFIENFTEGVASLEGVDTDELFSFIEEMNTARTSAFYDDEKMERYRAINTSFITEFINSNSGRRSSIQIARARDGIKFLPDAIQDGYF